MKYAVGILPILLAVAFYSTGLFCRCRSLVDTNPDLLCAASYETLTGLSGGIVMVFGPILALLYIAAQFGRPAPWKWPSVSFLLSTAVVIFAVRSLGSLICE